MRGKLNVKTIVILVVLLVVTVLGVIGIKTIKTFTSGATSDVEPTGVTVVSADDGKTATISWMSDKASISKVEYGTTAANLVLMSIENDSTTSHKILLTSLRSNTTYYYRIRIGEDVFDNGGIPYTFKTKGENALPTATSAISSTPLVNSGTECKNGNDYNKDGIVNSVDMLYCRQQGGKIVATAATSTPKPKVTSPATAACGGTVADYNSDGVINSLDRVNCLQSTD